MGKEWLRPVRLGTLEKRGVPKTSPLLQDIEQHNFTAHDTKKPLAGCSPTRGLVQGGINSRVAPKEPDVSRLLRSGSQV